MYVQNPEAIWNHLISELFSLETLLYVLGAIAFFAVIALVLEFLDSTRGSDK